MTTSPRPKLSKVKTKGRSPCENDVGKQKQLPDEQTVMDLYTKPLRLRQPAADDKTQAEEQQHDT